MSIASQRNEPIIQQPARPKGERRRTPWPLLLVILALLAALVIVPFMLLRPKADVFTVRSFETAVVERGTLVEYVRGGGTLVPRHERSVLAPGAGVLVDWLIAEGDDVAAGQLLGHVDSPELQRGGADKAQRRASELELEQAAAVREAASVLARLERTVSEARTALDSARTLYALGAIPRKDVEAAEAAGRSA